MTYRSVMDLTNPEWLAERAVPEHEVSDVVFVEGAWRRAQRIRHRNRRWLSSTRPCSAWSSR
jgi:hypothetical protein